jgi:hypothetical protein
VGESGAWVHNCLDGIKFKGASRTKKLREASDHEIRDILGQAGLKPSNHFVGQVKHIRAKKKGYETFADLEKIFRNGRIVSGNEPGTAVKVWRGMGVVFDKETKRLITLTPYEK